MTWSPLYLNWYCKFYMLYHNTNSFMNLNFRKDNIMINKAQVLEDIAATIEEVRAKAGEDMNGKQKRQIRALAVCASLIQTLVHEEEFTFDMEKELYQMIERKKGRSGVRIELHDGQSLMELLSANTNMTYDKLKKAIEEQDFKVVLDHIEKE